MISKDSEADDDIESRINKARHALNILQSIWKSGIKTRTGSSTQT
jgi:hypothetical protein